MEKSWFSHSELVRYATNRLAKWPHALLVLDACFAETLAQSFAHEIVVSDFKRAEGAPIGQTVYTSQNLYQDLSASDYYNHILVPRMTRWFIVSGTGPVADGGNNQHSPFARKLIEVLSRSSSGAQKGFLTRRDIEAAIELVRSGPISADIPGVGGGGAFVSVPKPPD